MKRETTILVLVMALVLGNMYGQDDKMKDKASKKGSERMAMEMKHMEVDVKNWPEASKMAVMKTTEAYGKPTGITEEELIWSEVGPWKKIRISKEESKHSFPLEHTDMLQMTVMYDVPEDKMDELGQFDGSVTFDRTQGFLSARCDLEANNFLALNLANDIITDKKTVEEARKAYADIIKEKMNGGNPEYLQKLTFASQDNAADPDENTMGMTKKEMMKKMKETEGK